MTKFNLLTLILPIILNNACQSAPKLQEKVNLGLDCKKFQIGKFYYYAGDLKIEKIRTIEETTDFRTKEYFIKSNITWLDECTFTSHDKEISDPIFSDEEKKKMFSETVRMVIEPINDHSYKSYDYRNNKLHSVTVVFKYPDEISKPTCTIFKTGKFFYKFGDNVKIKMIRTEDSSTEYRTDEYYILSQIHWIDSCSYRKKVIQVTDPIFTEPDRLKKLSEDGKIVIEPINDTSYKEYDYRDGILTNAITIYKTQEP